MKLGFMLAVIAMNGSAPASANCDLSQKDNVPAAYEVATGKSLPADSSCVRPSSTFPGLVWIGHFANDRGCIGEGVLVGCQLSPQGFASKAMTRAGWAKADLATRKQLALAWLREIDDLSPVETKPEQFPKPFTPPTATMRGKTTVIDLWTVSPPGMRPVDYYHHIAFSFGDDGTHAGAVTIEDLEVPMR